jgi:hypothetical protein
VTEVDLDLEGRIGTSAMEELFITFPQAREIENMVQNIRTEVFPIERIQNRMNEALTLICMLLKTNNAQDRLLREMKQKMTTQLHERPTPDGYTVKYRYDRARDEATGQILAHGGKTYCYLGSAESDVVHVGLAICHPHEEFNKRMGRHIARERAILQATGEMTRRLEQREAEQLAEQISREVATPMEVFGDFARGKVGEIPLDPGELEAVKLNLSPGARAFLDAPGIDEALDQLVDEGRVEVQDASVAEEGDEEAEAPSEADEATEEPTATREDDGPR